MVQSMIIRTDFNIQEHETGAARVETLIVIPSSSLNARKVFTNLHIGRDVEML